MAKAIITIQVMPETIDVDLKELEEKAAKVITKEGGEIGKIEHEPIAFGLQAIKFVFVIDEEKGTENIENNVSNIEGVQSARVVDYRRALG